MSDLKLTLGDNLPVLAGLEPGSVDLVYVDPPFNTGKSRKHAPLQTRRVADGEAGDRRGFGGRTYATTKGAERSYGDAFDDFEAFLVPRLEALHRVLKPDGALFLHLDPREVHYAKVWCDGVFGRASFMNELIWAYDFGGRAKRRWSAKHDNILWYAKDPARYTFHFDAMERIPYMAPGLVGKEKAARGKTPTDVWWHTIVPTAGKERTGYPTQKPLGVLRRIVAVHSSPGELVLDAFAGSGTTGAAALELGRRAHLIDANPEALAVMAARFAGADVTYEGWAPDPVPGGADDT